jgi:hypothetical protein
MKTMQSVAAGLKIDIRNIFRTIYSTFTPVQKPALVPVRVRVKN